MRWIFVFLIIVFVAGCTSTIGEDMESKNETTITGIYSEKYKGGPVLETNNTIIYLVNFPENSTYEGKRLEVTGSIFEDNETVVGPYKPGEPISQGWEEPRTVMNVTSFRLVE